jgi:hypothetical protein
MPADWRLAFFCNEFDAVVVPEARWTSVPPGVLAGWVAECGLRMRFFLEGREAAPVGGGEAMEALGSQFGGFVAPGATCPAAVDHWAQGAEDLRALRAKIEQLAASGGDALLIIEGHPPSLPALQAARTIAQLLGVMS